MVAAAEFRDQQLRTLVVGLGATGLSVARYLMSQGVQVAIADSRQEPPGLAELQAEYSDVAVFLGEFEDSIFEQADLLVVSPGVPLATPQIQASIARGVPVVGDIELFVAAAKAPIVAITGSNGKSTVTTLLGEMAKEAGSKVAVGGNLGIPALNLLSDDIELYVLELSSFQLETTHSLAAAVATVLNISPDHMDRYADLQAYADAKSVIFKNAGLGVFNADDERVMAMQGCDDAWFFTLAEPKDEKTYGLRTVDAQLCLCRGDEVLIQARDILIPGAHNQANVLAALAMGTALGFPLEAMTRVVRGFRGLEHRSEFVAEVNAVRWYNDSKATNVGATLAALQGMHTGDDSRTVIILGGDCKDGDFAPLHDALSACARGVVLFGRDVDEIAPYVPAACPLVRAADMDEVVARAAEMALPGDRVLLSPACASFDHFRNFGHRGDVFRSTVRRFLT